MISGVRKRQQSETSPASLRSPFSQPAVLIHSRFCRSAREAPRAAHKQAKEANGHKAGGVGEARGASGCLEAFVTLRRGHSYLLRCPIFELLSNTSAPRSVSRVHTWCIVGNEVCRASRVDVHDTKSDCSQTGTKWASYLGPSPPGSAHCEHCRFIRELKVKQISSSTTLPSMPLNIYFLMLFAPSHYWVTNSRQE